MCTGYYGGRNVSILDRYIAAHSKVYWDTDPKKEREARDRQSIARDYHSGNSIACILDIHPSEPKYQKIKGEKEWAVMQFTQAVGLPMRCERPCIDDTILWQDRDTKEAVAFTYHKSTFQKQMEYYWGCDEDE